MVDNLNLVLVLLLYTLLTKLGCRIVRIEQN